MSLLQRIQQDALAARKARETDRGVFLTTLVAEASKVGKDAGNRESTDAEVVAVVKKFAKNNEEATRALWVPEKLDTDPVRCAKRDKLMLERLWLMDYRQKEAEPAEVQAAIAEIVATLPERNMKQMGAVMGQLQTKFGGNFDKTYASLAVKQALASQ